MCGRFNIISDPLTRLLMELTTGQVNLVDQLNIAPTQRIPVVLMETGVSPEIRKMRWWLVPAWTDKPSTRYSMFNARSENLLSSRAFSTPFKQRRCVIPASGYYEWRKEQGRKVPYYIEPEIADRFSVRGTLGSLGGTRPGTRKLYHYYHGRTCKPPGITSSYACYAHP